MEGHPLFDLRMVWLGGGVEGHPLFDLRMVWLGGGGWRVTLFLICGWCGWVGGGGSPSF